MRIRTHALLSALGLGLVLAAAALFPVGLPGVVPFWATSSFAFALEDEEDLSVSEMGAALRSAVKDGVRSYAAKLVTALYEESSPEGLVAIFNNALLGRDHELERFVGKLLVGVEKRALRRTILTHAAKNRSFRVRVILLAVVARWIDEEPNALETLHRAIADPSKSVALTALSWLAKAKKAESVDPLIEQLARMEVKRRNRVYFDTLQLVRFITGAKLTEAADWKNYWELRGKVIEKKELTQRQERRTSVFRESPKFFTMSLNSDRVLFIVDISHSMLKRDPFLDERGRPVADESGVIERPQSRERLLRVKSELLRVIDNLPENTYFGIMTFSTDLHFWGATPRLQRATMEAKESAKVWISSLQAHGVTRTDRALAAALSMVEVDTIFLLPDGRPKAGGNVNIPIKDVMAMVRLKNRFRRCRINTIGFLSTGTAAMQSFVKLLAAQNDGTHHFLR